MERWNSRLYFQWHHKGSSAFRTFLLFVYDKTRLSSHAITFCHHTFFWRVFSKICYLSAVGLQTPHWNLPSWWLPFSNVTWTMPSGILGSKFSPWNFSLETGGWRDEGGAGVEEDVGTWVPDISVPDEAQSSMTISLGSQNSETKREYMWQVISFS